MAQTDDIVDLQKTLNLALIAEDTYISTEEPYVPIAARGIFGGTLVAQALYAAILTTADKYVPHSLHSYFLLPAKPSVPVTYKVDRLRDGKQFLSREVRAFQNDDLVFIETISFVVRNPAQRPKQAHLQLSKPVPQVNLDHYVSARVALDRGLENPKENGLTIFTNPKFKEIYLNTFEKGPFEYRYRKNYFESARHPNHEDFDKDSHEIETDYYIRHRKPIIDDRFHYVAFAYISDAYFLLTALRAHKRTIHSAQFSVSLDHSLFFHKQLDSNDWGLYSVRHPRAAGSRVFVYGELYQNDELVATATQEGLMAVDEDLLAKPKPKL